MKPYTIILQDAVGRNPLTRLPYPTSLEFNHSEQIAIVGENGSGKTLLTDILIGKTMLREGTINYDFTPSETSEVYRNIKYISFRDTYGSADACYQQRWNQTEQDDVPTVGELLTAGCSSTTNDEQQTAIYDIFSIHPMLPKKIISLSSGELRKFQLAKALLSGPRILILDNPFIGLDADMRTLLTDVLTSLSRTGQIQIILVLSILDDIPPFITHVIRMEKGRVYPKTTREDYLSYFGYWRENIQPTLLQQLSSLTDKVLDIPVKTANLTSEEIIRCNNVSIRYGSHTILSNVNWTVRQGERWALQGANGSGKSTLLSLVCADNPQSYACDISLFGRKRGSGESIWEIKRHIGYVSPEMHRSYMRNIPAIDIVASGLHDSIGLYVQPKQEQLEQCRMWMQIFGVDDKADCSFLNLSSGEQRLVLLARAFVKDPELLILDEPLHGLDTINRIRVKTIIEAFCSRPDKTLIMVTHYPAELPASITHRLSLSTPHSRLQCKAFLTRI